VSSSQPAELFSGPSGPLPRPRQPWVCPRELAGDVPAVRSTLCFIQESGLEAILRFTLHQPACSFHGASARCWPRQSGHAQLSQTQLIISSEPPCPEARCMRGIGLGAYETHAQSYHAGPSTAKPPCAKTHPASGLDRHVQEHTSCKVIQTTFLPTSRPVRCDMQLPPNGKMLNRSTAKYCCHCDQPELRWRKMTAHSIVECSLVVARRTWNPRHPARHTPTAP
jgi:hypothetical protein